jgi:hypothetical protein
MRTFSDRIAEVASFLLLYDCGAVFGMVQGRRRVGRVATISLGCGGLRYRLKIYLMLPNYQPSVSRDL